MLICKLIQTLLVHYSNIIVLIMAKFNPIVGTLSGRIGANIYAFNSGGFYVRNYVKQHYAGTPAQLAAKANFSSSNTYWSSVPNSNYGSWNTFGSILYNPLYARVGVKYSGHQAALGLYLSCASGNQWRRYVTFYFGTLNITYPQGHFVSSIVAPSYRLAPQIQSSTGVPINLNLASVTMASTGIFSAILQMDSSQSFKAKFSNPVYNEKCGFIFYCSKGINSTKSYFRRPLYFILGSTQIPSQTSYPFGAPYNQITISFPNTDITASNYKYFLVTGLKYRITCYLQSLTGQKALIGSQDVICS